MLREVLPDQAPYQAWVNFEFISDEGMIYEIDSLVVTTRGLFLVELKHYQGVLEGSGVSRWYRSLDGRSWEEDNPLLLANRKAKALRSIMQRQVGRDVRLPFITALVFLTNSSQDVRLRDSAAVGVAGPEGAPWVGVDTIPPIATALTSTAPDAGDVAPRQYTKEQLAAAVRAFSKLDIKPSVGRMSVRDYVLGKSLEHGDIFQDFLGEHRRSPQRKRRVRLYPHAFASSEEQRKATLRAAEREFSLFASFTHPGIDAPQEFEEHALGPALLFDYDPDATRLDRWLRLNADGLSIDRRLRLVRDIAEALDRAHEDRIFHRALDSHAVYVSGVPEDALVRIRNWHQGVRATLDGGATKLPTKTTSSLAETISADGEVLDRYRAPEARHTATARPRPADVFSLGAVTYHVLSGQEPATSASALDEHLLANDGLAIDAAIDGVTENMRLLVWQATQKDPDDRFSTVAKFLEDLDEVESHNRPDPLTDAASRDDIDPLEARKGDRLADRFGVLNRLGKGATAVALLVADEEAQGAERVLKVALSDEHDQQLFDEASALARLQHPQIVRLIGDPMTVGGRSALLLARAGKETLAERLDSDGPVDFEFLRRWGADLLQALAHLESEGIAHRDIKPANIGVSEQGKNQELHLVLFDFSLTRAPDHQLTVGTTGFIDPFLRTDGRNRWDTHAERFAAAVVLYQMSTNELPTWGTGNADPMMIADEVTLDPARFDPAIAGPLVEFFSKALARSVADRFGSATEMLSAWERALAEPQPTADDSSAVDYSLLTAESPLSELNLSRKVAGTLDRAGVYTVGDLLEINPVALNRMRGVGKVTIGEIRELVAELREHVAIEEPTALPVRGRLTVDRIVADLLTATDTDRQHLIVEAHLGLHPKAIGELANQARVAQLAATNQGTVSRTLIELRATWAGLPSLTAARELAVELLSARGGVATLTQLAQAFLARYGSMASSEERRAKGVAVARAVLEVESDSADPRWVIRRRGEVVLVALDRDAKSNVNVDLPAAEDLLRWTISLAERAETLAQHQPPLTSDRVIRELRLIDSPPGLALIDDRELVGLATAASNLAEVSSRGELYPKGMPAEEALRRSVGSLLGLQQVTPGQLADRIGARYPAAAPLPTPKQITPILRDLRLEFEWDAASGSWRAPDRVLGPSGVTSHTSTLTSRGQTDDGVDFSTRLELALNSGRMLVLAVHARHYRYQKALQALRTQDVTAIDVEDAFITGLKAKAADYEVDWEVVLEADSSPAGTKDANNLKMLVDQVMTDLEGQIVATPGTVLMYNVGPLVRYGHVQLIERLRNAIQFGDQPLRSVWVLTASEGTYDSPIIDGQAIGIISPSEFEYIPKSWLDAQESVA